MGVKVKVVAVLDAHAGKLDGTVLNFVAVIALKQVESMFVAIHDYNPLDIFL